jgi:HSP20 family molecular chaperone IbpA
MTAKNVKDARNSNNIEPETTFLDDGKFFCILTKLPGIPEEKIRIELEQTTVTITGSNDVHSYQKVIVLPSDARFSSKRFSDGILELFLEKLCS